LLGPKWDLRIDTLAVKFMPRPRNSPLEQSYKLQMELIPLYAAAIPAASRKRLAKQPPKVGILASEMDEYIHGLKTAADAQPIVYVSERKCKKILDEIGLKPPPTDLRRFFEELNSALLEYELRIAVERLPLSSWFPKYSPAAISGRLRHG
jgi:hypothetical protein